jgi:hypothetical protein
LNQKLFGHGFVALIEQQQQLLYQYFAKENMRRKKKCKYLKTTDIKISRGKQKQLNLK